MYYDPRVEGKALRIVDLVQKNESIHLSNQSRHDIFFTTRDVAAYWKKDSEKFMEDNDALWKNEMKLWIKKNRPHDMELQLIIGMLDRKESVRGMNTNVGFMQKMLGSSNARYVN